MRITLDYYRILGLPLAASDEQLRQAYSDRIVQLPRREYSQTAIASRKKLIEEAYVVLSDPKERKAYDRLYLAHAYDPERVAQKSAVAVESPLGENGAVDAQSLTIDVSPEEVPGALLLLQELGEYELVLKLGHPYLVNPNGTVTGNFGEDGEELPLPGVERPDIVLTVALACLELGREQWQQGHYENAAISLETGEELLAKEGLFPNVRAEIQADVYRLRPYRILELLAKSEEHVSERQQGLQLLQDVLEARGGIDGTGDDRSGLNVDDFLRFIQQIRHHLTVAEQHKLFESESKRPSAVAIYLAVYALIARGFTQRQPALIRQAKQMLMRLGRRQDVHLEQSLCALLLGQTEEATRTLELSQEYEALAVIREKSQDSPDLLPGLCLYGEQWLENEVFPHFRDLAQHSALLKEYFAEPEVQAYLEALPTTTETTNGTPGVNHQPFASKQANHPGSQNHYQQHYASKNPEDRAWETSRPTRGEYSNSAGSRTVWGTSQTPVTPISTAQRIDTGSYQQLQNGSPANTANLQQQTRRQPNQPVGDRRHRVVRRRRVNYSQEAKIRLMWMLFASVVGVLILWFLGTATFGLLENLFFPSAKLEGKYVAVELNKPPITIPDPNSKPQLPEGSLTEETAKEVIQTWLSTKATALGSNHNIESLEHILVDPALSQWQRIVKQDQQKNRYRQFEHQITEISIDKNDSDDNHAAVVAAVTEVAKFYDNGQINQRRSYDETVRVKYDLVKQEGVWRIQSMSIVNKIS
ncbi:MAG: IMS domain-containing protein [Nostocaceae cyanobacterium]|nr:IMS domain-containing protein [Nostocaceae cyanobacterium]